MDELSLEGKIVGESSVRTQLIYIYIYIYIYCDDSPDPLMTNINYD